MDLSVHGLGVVYKRVQLHPMGEGQLSGLNSPPESLVLPLLQF
jgi:hypothetical protein